MSRGKSADVYLAATEGVAGARTLCALHCLHPGMAESAHAVSAFLDRARLAVRLQHPNVIQTYGAGECEGTYFVASEYLEGQSLTELVRRSSGASESYPVGLWLRFVCDVLAGLEYAHDLVDYDGRPLRVVHRDIRPDNVFVTYTGHTRLLGFAFSPDRSLRAGIGGATENTMYHAPEEVFSEGGVDLRADVFAMGIMMWELLAGQRMSVRSRADPRLDAIVARALQKEPELRYQSAREMRHDIEAYLRASRVDFDACDVEDLLRTSFAEEREVRAVELRAFMRCLDGAEASITDVPDLGMSGFREYESHPRLRRHSTSPTTTSPSSSSGLRLNPRALAADLAELASPGPKRAGAGDSTGAKLSSWWVLALLLAAIAGLIVHFR